MSNENSGDTPEFESTVPAEKPTPIGDLWRFFSHWGLALGGLVCMIYFDAPGGALVLVIGIAYGNYKSGLDGTNDSCLEDTTNTADTTDTKP